MCIGTVKSVCLLQNLTLKVAHIPCARYIFYTLFYYSSLKMIESNNLVRNDFVALAV